MKTIKSNDLFRMSFILQDNSASTTSNYLAKIILYILFENTNSLEIEEIQQFVYDKFALEFTVDEIRSALDKATKRNNDIVKSSDNKYALSPQCANRLSKESSVEDELHNYVKKAKQDLNIKLGDEEFYNLITRYLYHCFNAKPHIIYFILL